jgi:hypothetical protein
MTFDLLPWETAPQAPEQAAATIEWNGGELVIPRLGYLTVDEMQGIREIDPQNALYRLITAAAVELAHAMQADADRIAEHPGAQARALEFPAHRCYGLLTRLLAQEQGARIGRMSPEEEAVQVLYAGIIAPFLVEARAITNRVTIRAVTVILQRIKPAWTDEQTRKLPGPLLGILHAFEQEEGRAGAGLQQDPAAEMRALEEALGKLQEVVGSTATDPTGPEPSGTAADSGPEPPSSAASDSGSSPPAMSSRPSRRATPPNAKGFTGKRKASPKSP